MRFVASNIQKEQKEIARLETQLATLNTLTMRDDSKRLAAINAIRTTEGMAPIVVEEQSYDQRVAASSNAFKNRANASLPLCSQQQGALAGRFQTRGRVIPGQTEQPQAGAIRKLRMPARLQQPANELFCLWTDAGSPLEKAFGVPFALRAMMRWHMFGNRGVAFAAFFSADV